jgi:hypothetical protein
MDDQVHHGEAMQDQRTHQLAQAPLQQVALDGGSSVLGYDEPDARVRQTRKGSAHPNVEMFGAKALPCSRDLTKLGASCDAMTARKRRRRTRLLVRDRC